MPPSDPRIAAALQLHQAHNHPAAEAAYRHVLANQPNHPDAMLLMGILLHEMGRHDESIDLLERGIGTVPQPTEFRRAIVNPLVAVGDLGGAIEQSREVTRRQPGAAEPHVVLAQLLARAGDHAAATVPARRAVELSPANPVAWLTVARCMAHAGRAADALAAFDHALAIAPTFADAAVERAFLLQRGGRWADAAAGYADALRLAPDNLAALNNAGACHLAMGQLADAAAHFEAAARLAPDDPKPRGNIGVALREAGQIDLALPHLAAAARMDPTDPVTLTHIGTCHAAVADHRRAVDAFRSALAIDPAFDAAGSDLLLSLLAADGVPPATLAAEHAAWGRRFPHVVRPAIADPRPDRRLRVGYLSPDFCDGDVRHFIEPVLVAHDRSAVEVVCYAAGRRRDDVTARLSAQADAWHDVAALDAAATADLIRSHGVDVLVDLAGHGRDNRLAALARRPAPVQVSWLGSPATTGLPAVDFRLTDAVADPPGTAAAYTERLVVLPGPFAVYADDPAKPYDVALPADRHGHVTFGAFDSFAKVTPTTLATWAAVLSAVPTSRLLMVSRPLDNPSTRAAVMAAFAAAGVAADRLDLRLPGTPAEQSALLGGVDLLLDTFPWNGHATTLAGLWMGVPTVTRYGAEFRGRMGLSVYSNLGLADELATATPEAFVQRAVALAADPSRLRELRPTWRERLRASPLCDAKRFTRGLEGAYRQMWAKVCSRP